MMTSQVTTVQAATAAAPSTSTFPSSSTSAAAVVAAPQQVPQQAPGAAAAGGITIVVLLIGVVLAWQIKTKKAKPLYVALAFTMGALLSGSIVGVMAQETAGTIGSGVQTMLTTVSGTNP